MIPTYCNVFARINFLPFWFWNYSRGAKITGILGSHVEKSRKNNKMQKMSHTTKIGRKMEQRMENLNVEFGVVWQTVVTIRDEATTKILTLKNLHACTDRRWEIYAKTTWTINTQQMYLDRMHHLISSHPMWWHGRKNQNARP